MREFLDFIPDGYSEEAFIAKAPGFHGELRFRYRPCDAIEQGKLLELAEHLKLDQERRQLSESIAAKIERWSLAGPGGEAVAVSADALRRLRPRLYSRVTRIVMGLEASDEDPQWSAELKQAAAETAAVAAMTGGAPGQVKAAIDQGN